MSDRVRGCYDDALYKSMYTLLYYAACTAEKAHTMLQIAVPLFTHIFRKFVGLVFFSCHWTPCNYDTILVAAAGTWNSLPQLVTLASLLQSFRARLETYIFLPSFSSYCACTFTLVILDTLFVYSFCYNGN